LGLGLGLVSSRNYSFQDLVTDSQTDRDTERRSNDMRSQDRALHYRESRGKNAANQRNRVNRNVDVAWSEAIGKG